MTLKPGESVETVSGGCCQIQVKKCNKDRCPPTESCPAHLVEKINAETLSDCCPEPTCGECLKVDFIDFIHDILQYYQRINVCIL